LDVIGLSILEAMNGFFGLAAEHRLERGQAKHGCSGYLTEITERGINSKSVNVSRTPLPAIGRY
jgi:hypothetical protein